MFEPVKQSHADFNKQKACRYIIFLLLFVSGACSLSYQIIWTRLAYASFGVITPVLSIVISVFMLGLALGAWLAGKYVKALSENTHFSAVVLYGIAEALIGVGGFTVPLLYGAGANLLLSTGELNSTAYLTLSALLIMVATLPWCICMGATLPLMIAFMQEVNVVAEGRLSFLYVANVLGALVGTLLTTFALIELLGFRHTLMIMAIANVLVALSSLYLAKAYQGSLRTDATKSESVSAIAFEKSDNFVKPQLSISTNVVFLILFATGFLSMAMEVVWTRAFFYVLGNEVYSFASLLIVYLFATFIGSSCYRRDLANKKPRSIDFLLALSPIAALVPILTNDPRPAVVVGTILSTWLGHPAATQNVAASNFSLLFLWKIVSIIFVLASIAPLCFCLGYLTPQLIEMYSQDEPEKVGRAYAANVLGCILGPLFAAYVILPAVSPKDGLLALAVPFIVLFILVKKHQIFTPSGISFCAGFLVFQLIAIFVCTDYEQFIISSHKHHQIRRDYAATSLAVGEGYQRDLIVNGRGVTNLCQGAKNEAHLPLLLLKHQPQLALDICFGIGTTYRSLLSWNVKTIAVELVPSVRDLFGFFHDDAAQVMRNPNGSVVIDDGRRYLKRTGSKFDIITVDPPPPFTAAGLSLLISDEFYSLAKNRLSPGGVVHMFIPYEKSNVTYAIVRSCKNNFPYVRTFMSQGCGAFHMLASMEPLDLPELDQALTKMPEAARLDLTEWSKDKLVNANPKLALKETYNSEIPLDELMSPDQNLKISDDHPFNEYFLLRYWADAIKHLFQQPK